MAVATLYSVTPFHASLSSSARKIPHPITSFRFNPHSISISRFGSHPPGLFSLSFWSRFSVASIVAPILSSRVLRVHGLVDDDSVTAPEPKSENSKAGATLGLNFPRRSLFVQFTCDLCGERTKRLVNRLAFERGAIFVQDPSCTKGTTSNEDVSKKRPLGVLEQDHVKATGLASISEDSLRKQVKLDHASETEASSLETVEPETTMEQEKEKDAFFVVRKGDVVGIYKTLTDSQAQVGSSVCDPPVSVYKGYSLSKNTEEYLLSHGLKNALYTIRASDLKEDLFGTLFPCPLQDPSCTKGTTSNEDVSKKRPLGVLEQDHVKATGLASISEDPLRKQVKLDHASEAEASSLETRTCILEFDGASKGNPGISGAGAILRSIDGSLIYRLREGVGIATNNAAEYRAMILGMKYALQKGFTGIRIKGDSKLVCMQIDGSWKVKNENLSILYKVAKELKDKFVSFQISRSKGRNSIPRPMLKQIWPYILLMAKSMKSV